MNRIRSKRKQAGLSVKDMSAYLDLPWFIYLYFELRIEDMPLCFYTEICRMLDIDLERV